MSILKQAAPAPEPQPARPARPQKQSTKAPTTHAAHPKHTATQTFTDHQAAVEYAVVLVRSQRVPLERACAKVTRDKRYTQKAPSVAQQKLFEAEVAAFSSRVTQETVAYRTSVC